MREGEGGGVNESEGRNLGNMRNLLLCLGVGVGVVD